MIDHVSDTATGKGYIITPATKCSADGEERVTCKVCGQEFIRPISAHNYDNGVVAVAAKCTETGTMKYTCKDCGATKTEDIEALGHNLGTTIELIAPTCEKTGISEKVCSRCGYEEKTVTKALGHAGAKGDLCYFDAKGNKLGTVESMKELNACEYDTGYEYTCSNYNSDTAQNHCNEKEGKVVEIVKKATGHTIDTTKPVSEGYATLKLTKVPGEDNVYTYNEKDMYVTDEDGIVIEKTGTVDCSHEKVKAFTCANCEKDQIVVLQERTAHTGSVVTVPTTCTTKGYTLTSCTKCNKVIKEVDEKAKLLEHEYTFVAATCTEAAYIKCDIGGEKYTDYVSKVDSDKVVADLELNADQKAELTNNTPLGHDIVSKDGTKGYCSRCEKWIEGAAEKIEAAEIEEDLLGQELENLQKDVVITDGYKLKGELKYVSEFEEFNSSNETEQSGNYLALSFDIAADDKINVKVYDNGSLRLKNGTTEGTTLTNADSTIIIRVTDKTNKIVLTFYNGENIKNVITLDPTTLTLAPADE